MIYLASSWKNKYYPEVLAALRAAGHEVYDFRAPHGDPNEHGFHWTDVDPDCMNWTAKEYQRNLSHPLAEQQFENDLEALDACDTCVLLLPCGRSAHTEAGWMAGQGKRVFVLLMTSPSPFTKGDTKGDVNNTEREWEPELMYKLFDGVCTSMEELLEALSFDPDQIMCIYGPPFPEDF